MNNADTIPKSLLKAVELFGKNEIAMRQKQRGIWKSFTWGETYNNVKLLSLGLVKSGLKPGDKVCIIGDNDHEYFWALMAVQAARAITIGIYTDSTPPEVEYIVNHSEATFVFAKDQEQCDKLLDIQEKVPRVLKVIFWDHKGLENYNLSWLVKFSEIQAIGKELEKNNPSLFEDTIHMAKADDLALFCYTSGTTGLPKGVMHSHRTMITGCDNLMKIDPRTRNDQHLSFTPPAWIVENLLGLTVHLRTGMFVNFPEAPETVQENIREIAPQLMQFSPKQWESMLSTVQIKINESTWINRLMYKLMMPVGYKVADLRYEQQKPVSLFWRILYAIGEFLLFQPLRDNFGFTRVVSAYSSGSAIDPAVVRFFRSIGVNIKNLYGSTETLVSALPVGDDVKFATVGKALPGVNLRITESGEIQINSETTFVGYFKDPKATSDAFHIDDDGSRWYKTGDAGHIEEDEHLVYLDRVNEMITLASGDIYSPQFLEGRLKFSPYIRDVMTIGGSERTFVTALVNIDFDYVGKWAEKRGISYTTYVDLSQKPEIYRLIQADVERVNHRLPKPARIKKFVLMHKEFDADEGELTRTRKLRRKILATRYENIITSIYFGGGDVEISTPVKYRDGREATINTKLHIATVNP